MSGGAEWPTGPLTLKQVEEECERRGHEIRGDACVCTKARRSVLPPPDPDVRALIEEDASRAIADAVDREHREVPVEVVEGGGDVSLEDAESSTLALFVDDEGDRVHPPTCGEIALEVFDPLIEAWTELRSLCANLEERAAAHASDVELEALRRARLCLLSTLSRTTARLGPDPVTSKSVAVVLDEEIRAARCRADAASRTRRTHDVSWELAGVEALQRLRAKLFGAALP